MQEMETQGKRFGTEHNPLRMSENSEYGAEYSFPVEREEFLFCYLAFRYAARSDGQHETTDAQGN